MNFYKTYGVDPSSRAPLLQFVSRGLTESGCSVLFVSEPNTAPFRVVFETPWGERVGILIYAFLANCKNTRNRPVDEWRFQIKYGGDLTGEHEIFQDPARLYTTLMCGINADAGFFAGIDPTLHNPTRFSRSVEFKQRHVDQIKRSEWTFWDRPSGRGEENEIVVGGTGSSFLKYVFFEREVLGEDQDQRRASADLFSEIELDPFQNGSQVMTRPILGTGVGRPTILYRES